MKKFLLLALAAISLRASAQSSLASGLLGRFPFDNSLADVTSNIGPGSSSNVAYGPDAHGQANAALRLTGTGEVGVQPNGLLDFGTTGSFTFTVAFRTLSSGTQAFFSNKGYSTPGSSSSTSTSGLSKGWSMGFDNSLVGRLYVDLVRDNFSNGGLALVTQANSYNDGRWHTAALVVNRSTRQFRLFVDGAAQPLAFVSYNPNYGTASGTVFTLSAAYSQLVDMTPGYSLNTSGTNTINNRFGLSYNGWLDEARFYNRVLTDAELQTLSAQVLATLNATAAAAQVQLFPSPAVAGAPVAVQLAQPVVASQLRVLDVLGRVVPVSIAASRPGGTAYELRGLPSGLYLLQVTLPEGLAVRRLQME